MPQVRNDDVDYPPPPPQPQTRESSSFDDFTPADFGGDDDADSPF